MTKIENIFKKNNGYLSAHEVTSRSMWYHLQKMIALGQVSKIKRGVYVLNAAIANHKMIDTQRIVPKSVLCLYSAWDYYHLTTTIPGAYYLAVEKSRKINLPEFPPIKMVYLKKEYFELGVKDICIDGFRMNIYDIEKSVCDAVKYRNKIGIETTAEIINKYLALKNRNIDKLVKYAKKMRIYTTLKLYLEIKL